MIDDYTKNFTTHNFSNIEQFVKRSELPSYYKKNLDMIADKNNKEGYLKEEYHKR